MSHLVAGTRPFILETIAGYDLHVRSFTGEEAISKLFRFQLLVHSDFDIPVAELLGQPVTFVLGKAAQRKFFATISAVEEFGSDEHSRAVYGLELVPRIWALTQNIQARVFENLNPTSIIDKVFADTQVTVTHPTPAEDRARPYCVQYFESDFAFAVRLLEEEGYVYQYEAAADRPVFVIRQAPSATGALGEIQFHEVTGHSDECILSWKKTRILTATEVRARDHLFQAGSGSASPVLDVVAGLGQSKTSGWEPLTAGWSARIDRYPGQWAHLFDDVSSNGAAGSIGGYKEFGEDWAKRDLRQVAGSMSASEGVSNCERLAPGCVFTLGGHTTSAGEHYIVSVHHKGSQAFNHSTGAVQTFQYENRFTCFPRDATTLYRPPRSTRKPLIHGCQTAKVVGSMENQEIWTDKYGRVQVQFWWDRESSRSCWIRVATPWAGSGWGFQFVPRVGQEVVVAFLDGDPDRPLIVGSVYNPTHMPPYELPDNQTQSGIRTHTTPGGGPDQVNEIAFEDAEGAEQIYIHAQKDREAIVENNSEEFVRNKRTDVVGKDFHAITGGRKRESVAGKSSLIVGGDCMNSISGKLGINAAEIHLRAGKIVIEADAISIRASGDNSEFIHIGKGDGITIDSKGSRVWLNCGGAGTPDEGCFAFTKDDAPANPYNPPPAPPAPATPPAPPAPPPPDDPCHLKK